jgi:hypothetical protein
LHRQADRGEQSAHSGELQKNLLTQEVQKAQTIEPAGGQRLVHVAIFGTTEQVPDLPP